MTDVSPSAGSGGSVPRMRSGTTDRQAAVDRLSAHFAEGRLDTAEFDQRVATAYGSTYLDELTPLFADLPQSRSDRPPWAAGPYGHRPPGLPGGANRDRSEWGGWGPGGRRPGPPPPVRVALFVLLLFMVIGSISAVGHGFFPFPLIWLMIVLLLIGRMRHRRWSGHGRR